MKDSRHVRISADDAIRQVSEMHALYWRTPRILTEKEKALWQRFEALLGGEPEEFTARQLARCFEIAFKWERYADILTAAELLPEDLIRSDRDADMWVTAARVILEHEANKK